MFFLAPLAVLSLPAVILAAAAVIPAVFLLVKVYQADKIEKEPPALIWSLAGLGVLSTFCAIVTETIGDSLLQQYLPEGSLSYNIWMYFIIVALSEEGFKYLFLHLKTWNSREFNYQFDGVVYAVSVGAGFALFENLEYVFSYGLATAAVRAVTAVPGHVCFAVFMGTWYGGAKRYANCGEREKSGLYSFMALLIPVLMHGSYDFIASSESAASSAVFLIFIILMFYLSWRTVSIDSAKDEYIG